VRTPAPSRTSSGGAWGEAVPSPETSETSSMTLRARFAPSPTGYLHVGGARTALFNWLLVRKEGGVFVLRIEDTDRERSTEAHTQAILTGMEWLGLDWDEGPFFQSQGLERHKAHALQLLESGAAYRDFSKPEAAAQDREEEKASGGRSRKARQRADAMSPGDVAARLEAGEPFAVRFRVPEGETVWQDGVHGEMRFKNDEIDDLVILRSDGTPTYNLAVVSDDVEMGITLVLRGDDHLSNTPKQILLYEALGRPVPTFAHVPLILGPDGKRLSKRHGATAVGDYEKEGILPEAMFNFLAFLGWSPGDDREIFSRPELVEAFSLERVLKKSAVFDLEKLRWMNGQHLMRMPTEELLPKVEARLREEGVLGTPGTAHAPETPPAADVAKAPGTAHAPETPPATDVAKTPGTAAKPPRRRSSLRRGCPGYRRQLPPGPLGPHRPPETPVPNGGRADHAGRSLLPGAAALRPRRRGEALAQGPPGDPVPPGAPGLTPGGGKVGARGSGGGGEGARGGAGSGGRKGHPPPAGGPHRGGRQPGNLRSPHVPGPRTLAPEAPAGPGAFAVGKTPGSGIAENPFLTLENAAD
jgi:glutamyl-tRNA synthetase